MRVDLIIKYAGEERVFENLEVPIPIPNYFDDICEAVIDHFQCNSEIVVLDSLTKREL